MVGTSAKGELKFRDSISLVDLITSIESLFQKEFSAAGKFKFLTSDTYILKASEIELASFMKFFTNLGWFSQE
tara:strand:+ start:426 stop:644 length:219 start_codon:yes stop_codon:yes gene_type:complete